MRCAAALANIYIVKGTTTAYGGTKKKGAREGIESVRLVIEDVNTESRSRCLIVSVALNHLDAMISRAAFYSCSALIYSVQVI